MEKKKIRLSFVNNGEEFVMPYITVKVQEDMLKDVVEVEKTFKKDTDEFMREINKYIMVRVLQQVDPTVSIKNINNLHPDDYVELMRMMNQGGRELSHDEPNFPKKKKKN